VSGWIEFHEPDDPWLGQQPRFERLVSDAHGRFFVDARLPSGEVIRTELGRFSLAMRWPMPGPERRGLVARLHNPRGRVCACLEECWCKRSRLGYLVRWYTPARWHRLPPPPMGGRK
jgi:hypothetical protein